MSDEQLLEEYSKEVFGSLYSPSANLTVSKLIESHRTLRQTSKEYKEMYNKKISEGYNNGYNWGVKNAAENAIQYEDLRKMTIQDLANLIGTDDE